MFSTQFIDHKQLNIFNILMIYSYTLSLVVSNFVATFVNLLTPRTSEQFSYFIDDLVNQIEKVFHLKIPMDKFRRNFHWKIFIILIFALLSAIPKAFFLSSIWKPTVDIFAIFSRIHKLIIVLQSILFIDLIRFSYLTLNTKLKSIDFESHKVYSIVPNQLRVVQELKNVKRVHFKIWTFCRRFNHRFGWILGVYLLEEFLYVTTAIYWTILYGGVVVDIRTLQSIRKYLE